MEKKKASGKNYEKRMDCFQQDKQPKRRIEDVKIQQIGKLQYLGRFCDKVSKNVTSISKVALGK